MVADSFHLPIVFLADNPGMLPGSRSDATASCATARMFTAQTVASTVKLHPDPAQGLRFGSMVMSLLGFDDQVAAFGYPGATMGRDERGRALGRAAHADANPVRRLRDAELQASFNSAENYRPTGSSTPAGPATRCWARCCVASPPPGAGAAVTRTAILP